MKTHQLKTEIWLPQKRSTVFSFFADPGNLEALTPGWLHFKILTPMPLQMKPGVSIGYRLRLYGIPLRWQSKISVWEPPHRFVDRQVRGPYRLWIHEHTFAEVDGGTLVRDVVEYAALGGILVQKLFLARDLKRIFAYRHARLRQRFGGSDPQDRTGLRKSPSLSDSAKSSLIELR
ncbi:MAG TPA: SRPBCC family protein [Candidatus Binatia bacterium]|nr:SRPBCC family protein [Candidatus Binatia bacterium]